MRIHILARDIRRHDAVGDFCRQMAVLFRARGADVALAAENCDHSDCTEIGHLPAALGAIAPTDVVFFHFSTEDPTLPAVAALSNPKVIYFHNITPERFFVTDNPPTARLVRQGLAQRPLAAKFDVFMANSGASAGDLHDGLAIKDQMRIAASDIVVCPPVVDVDRWSGVTPTAVPLPAVDRLVLFVGRLVPHKNVRELIDGFSTLAASDDGVGLAVVGAATDRAYTRTLLDGVNRLSANIGRRIAFFHNVSDGIMKFLLDRAGVVASMSAHEGFGIPLVDAMVFDKPLVISAQQAMMETAGDAALVVPDPAPVPIAAALARAMDDRTVGCRLAAARKDRLAELRRLADGRLIVEAADAAAAAAKERVLRR